jgi:hypothetical protein
VEFANAIERVTSLEGTVVEVQLLSREESATPIGELSGVLSRAGLAEAGSAARDSNRPVTFRIGDGRIWLWPRKFVLADPLGSRGGIELVTEDVIVLIGPKAGPWIDEDR